MQNTESAGQPGSTKTVPALPGALDLAVPQGGTEEDHTSAGSTDVSKEFTNTGAGGAGPSPKEMDGPVKTINSVNPKTSMEERGPREAQAHANTNTSTDPQTKEDRSEAPHVALGQ